ncbi:MAG: UDP-glucose 6-dehydrogenase [Vicingaceae bacterium]|nr:MAG: UDP-glucose 6-dehydrogenase [Vicingaceae bacterium]
MKITVIGTGYVGLVTGTCLAETGNQVLCVDIDEEKIKKLKSGIIPIYEPHLDVIFERNQKQGRLKFTTSLQEGVDHGEVIFLALPTPPKEDGSADLKYVLEVSEQIAHLMKSYKIIVSKSTVPVGTVEKITNLIKEITQVPFDVVSNPEFLREGFAVDDFMKPDRVVIGTSSEKAAQIMKDLYKPFVRQGNPILIMDEKSAELTKYAANAFLATKITFMNEIANYCEKVGANVDNVRIGIGLDERIGKRFLFPGVGYGGSCFPKDVKALIQSGQEQNIRFKILEAVDEVNNRQKQVLLDKIEAFFQGNIEGRKFAVWGLSFKPDTDDIREAPSLVIIKSLIERGANVSAYDPEAMNNVRKELGDIIHYAQDMYEALEGSDALIIVTEWNVFRTPDLDKVKSLLKQPVIFDGRNVFDWNDMQGKGFYYFSIGRKAVIPQ